MPPGGLKPPRPSTTVAGVLMLAGAVVMAIGCFLPWLSGGGESVNGFDQIRSSGDNDAASGVVFVFLAVVLLAFGITTLAAKRILAIMIIGIVVASLCLLGALGEFSDYNDFADRVGIDIGAGLPVVMIGSAVGLAGAIAGCAKRRRWVPSPTPYGAR